MLAVGDAGTELRWEERLIKTVARAQTPRVIETAETRRVEDRRADFDRIASATSSAVVRDGGGGASASMSRLVRASSFTGLVLHVGAQAVFEPFSGTVESGVDRVGREGEKLADFQGSFAFQVMENDDLAVAR